MSQGYKIVRLDFIVEQIGESETKQYLRDFISPLNKDVEDFLYNKAIEFSKQGIAKTHLVIASFQNEDKIAGYFALSGNKFFTIKAKSKAISGKMRRRISRFGQYDADLKQYFISVPLIGQLGKNYNYPSLITGDELLELACSRIKEVQLDMGGRFVYLECEPIPKLCDFYERNGFVVFGERELDGDERGFEHQTLLQLLKYLDPKKD